MKATSFSNKIQNTWTFRWSEGQTIFFSRLKHNFSGAMAKASQNQILRQTFSSHAYPEVFTTCSNIKRMPKDKSETTTQTKVV